jgi:UDP-N-acetylmuramate--alanine ligase
VTREAAAIGAGLAPARPARAIRPGERIHVIGAAGAGASAAALLASWAGAEVTGCDAGGPSPYSPALDAAGIGLAWAHDPLHVTHDPHPDRLAVTKALTAVDPDNPELRAAHELGIAVEPWQQVVADAAAGRRLVAVAGTHGKSTTAGWLLHVLVEAGLDPGAFVGALLPTTDAPGSHPATARRGGGDVCIVEADEYAGNFLAYRPDVAVVTGAEWDHPDVFADRDAVIAAFAAWLDEMPDGGTVVVNVADPGGAALAARLAGRQLRIIPTALVDDRNGGTSPAGGIVGRTVGRDRDGTWLEVHGLRDLEPPVRVRLTTAGRHNAANALAVIGAAHALGVPPATIVDAVGTFAGVGRRLERKGEADGVVVYDDYGHHPTAIHETIDAVRQREPGRRVWAVYEPLTYHRTAAMLDDFADALAEADAVAVADIWAGRDPDTSITSAGALAAAVSARRQIVVLAPGDVAATADALAASVRSGDAVLVMGGGNSYRIAERLLEQLAGRA